MHNTLAQTVFRKDYQQPDFLVDFIDLGFDLDPEQTHVANQMTLIRREGSKARDILLYGNGLKLAQLRMNGVTLGKDAWRLEDGNLRIFNAPDIATLEIETVIHPAQNTSLMGLYVSNGNFFTQCEAEGFRKITFFPDRPDVLTRFTVMLRADRKKYPVLLSNGNLIEQGKLPGGRHYAKW
ncbi:MAG: pepN, partial [Burkholderiaceae bacterium]|nr:pepN [Burkholderiaceae bacterium]